MDHKSKHSNYCRLRGVENLEADAKLLQKLAPGARPLRRMFEPDKRKLQCDILWALLDYASYDEIVANRGIAPLEELPGKDITGGAHPVDPPADPPVDPPVDPEPPVDPPVDPEPEPEPEPELEPDPEPEPEPAPALVPEGEKKGGKGKQGSGVPKNPVDKPAKPRRPKGDNPV